MSDLSKYGIDIIGLKNQEYQYQYLVDQLFFRNFENNEIEKGSLNCIIVLNKTDDYIDASFQIDGSVELICDRSLDKFDYNINLTNRILFKYGEEDREIDDKVEMISRNRQTINMAQYIYEFVITGMPMKKLHPRYLADDIKEEIVYSSGNTPEESEKQDQEVDPRWEALKKLRNN
jgi:uncharacterized metal-binding protein YceD (DUF177 family)